MGKKTLTGSYLFDDVIKIEQLLYKKLAKCFTLNFMSHSYYIDYGYFKSKMGKKNFDRKLLFDDVIKELAKGVINEY